MKKLIGKTIWVWITLLGFTAYSMGTLVQNKHVLNQIHAGMSTDEVSQVMGQPDFRQFHQKMEEWEYHKWLSGMDEVEKILDERNSPKNDTHIIN